MKQVYEPQPENFNYSDLLVPVPHSCDPEDIILRQQVLGDTGLYYPMLYTTLFMWGVEFLGYEIFSLASIAEADRFHEKFILPAVQKSKMLVEKIVSASESPFVFLHDDLASASGPVFPPEWYNEYIFPHYSDIFLPAKEKGKKIILVADGNMDSFLEKLTEEGVDGLMFENPATHIDKVVNYFSDEGKFLIGGMDTSTLTFGTPEEIKKMVLSLAEKMRDIPGFAISSCGGLHGNIPMENLEAYFDARAEIGATNKGWRTNKRA